MKYWLLMLKETMILIMGAYEITSVLKDIDDASYKSENFVILRYCLEYYNDNPYISEYLEKTYSQELVVFQEPVEEKNAETEISLDEKEQESEGQTEDLPSNDSNSLTLTLYNYPPCL